MAKEKTAVEIVDNFKEEHNDAIELTKFAAGMACSSGVHYAVQTTLNNVCPASTKFDKVGRFLGGWIIASVIASKVDEVLDKTADDLSDGIVWAINKGRKVKTYFEERN